MWWFGLKIPVSYLVYIAGNNSIKRLKKWDEVAIKVYLRADIKSLYHKNISVSYLYLDRYKKLLEKVLEKDL